MCGIVGLFLKDPALEPELGKLLADMLVVMTGRGPDSAGFAVYGAGDAGHLKLTVRGGDLDSVVSGLAGLAVATRRDTHLVLSFPVSSEELVRGWLALNRPDLVVTGSGSRIELYKEVGLPLDVANRFGLPAMIGTHGIGHTRMATESAVTTDGAHPFSTGRDQCLVHNGSLSNHRSLRRRLEHEGLSFVTDNDSEVAAGFISWRLREGDSLTEALEAGLEDLDGFYTFVIGTENGFAVMRDPISCKPAVMAETDQYVAFGSEYRALVNLPGIEKARVFEPEPARAYVWERN
ncbi:class II glutamine amidotransferase [Novosphingobium nitrogenifigens]|uniref:class II glutamine amidotransferase n=1 Tax=Novosphingobium nitrogenifigens TaxID=378548 RepID=UPI000378D71D|nr:glutamine amidotransferase family protein [Novosphingobium nitrogenifigens]